MASTPNVAPDLDFDEFDNFDFDDLVEDVSLDDDLEHDEHIPLADLTRTSEHPGGVIVYPHAFSIRFRPLLSKDAAVTALAPLGWHPGEPTGWKTYTPKAGRPRHVIKGSAWLTHTAPRDKRHLLTRFNTEHKTRLYGIAIEDMHDHYEVDLLGVRIPDVRIFFEHVLGLTGEQYELLYYRQAERYIVLDPHDAHRLGHALEGEDRFGGGRYCRKHFLLPDRPLEPIPIRARSTAIPVLTLYRIEPGATAEYRLEVRLRGRRADRTQFHEADIPKLDDILLDLVHTHGLTPVPKPARWEPRSMQSHVERAPADPQLARIPLPAYRGKKLKPAQLKELRKCHTPHLAGLIATSHDDDTFPRPRRVSALKTPPPASPTTITTTTSTTAVTTSTDDSLTITPSTPTWTLIEGGPTAVTLYRRQGDAPRPPRPRFTGTWAALAQEIASLGGYLSEVVLDAEEPPMALVEALVRHGGRKVGFGLISLVDPNGFADTWLPLLRFTDEHPLDDDIGMLVLLFDPSIAAEVEDPDYHFDEETLEWAARATPHEGGKFEEDPLARSALPLGATYWPVLAELRKLAEEGGISVVLVTADMRKPTGHGDMRKSHYYTDARVRSMLGDASRYWCHQRYRVEPTATVTLKDEAEGKTGRRL